MRLIDPLVSGMSGAGNGYVELYRRGTSTRATWFADFEGTTANSSGANITLDSYGAAVVYVDETVDVIVKSLAGALIREFTWGEAASGVEVISRSFTGTDYISGATGPDKPVALDEVLDDWFTSAGAVDWKVLAGGTVRTLQSLATILGEVFVVTDPQFGAVGDMTTDDLAAINACIAACSAAGGGFVFFPAGTYRVSGAITGSGNVHLVGAGSGAPSEGSSIAAIVIDHATANTLNYTSNGSMPLLISDLAFKAVQPNTGRIIDMGASGLKLTVNRCDLGEPSNSRGTLIQVPNNSGARLDVLHCKLTQASATAAFINSQHVSARVRMLQNELFATATNYSSAAAVNVANLQVMGDYWTVTSNAVHTWLSMPANSKLYIFGLIIDAINGGGSFQSNITFNAATCRFLEYGLDAPNVTLNATAPTSTEWRSEFRNRRQRSTTGGSTGAAVTVNTAEYGFLVLTILGTNAFTLNIDGEMPVGTTFTVIIANEHGAGSGSITLESNVEQGSEWRAGITVANNDWRTIELMCVEKSGGAKVWIQIGAQLPAGVNPA